jgi:hypothetical protein
VAGEREGWTTERGVMPADVDEYLAVYLAPRGGAPGIGPEKGHTPRDGIAKYVSPHGSYRYVAFVVGEPVSTLQVVSMDGRHAVVANVYTKPEHRREGWAAKLLTRARRDFDEVTHADERKLSSKGRAWSARVR